MKAVVVILAAAAASLAAGTAAAEPECPATSPRVEVALHDPEPTFDFRSGMDALRAEADAPRNAAHRHLGVTTSRVEWQSEIEARIVSASGRVCARPERVALNLRHAEHGVRIARELPRGGCLFRETEAHERRHVAANRATLRRAASEAEAAARRWAASAVGRGATEQSAMAALREDLRRAIAPAIEAMQAARDAAHREIDRPEEYERLGRVCPDEQKALGERPRGR
jgi:hypothetical protein